MSRWLIAVLCIAMVTAACGTEGDPFGGADNTPSSGVSPYKKVDIDKKNELTQPFIIFPEYDERAEYIEPEVLESDGKLWMWFELARFEQDAGELVESGIYLIWSYDGMIWDYANGGLPVLKPTLEWEENHTGAPAIIKKNGLFFMWYCAAQGKTIGLATSTDGINWTKQPTPVLMPDQPWEQGRICSPAVAYHKGRFRMWYGGGNNKRPGQGFCGTSAIGYAESPDGITWVKRDAAGNSSENSDQVQPILSASQSWEGNAVGYPSVKVERNLDQWLYKMWYTGQTPGELFFDDASIGFAGSTDGLNWEKAPDGINPILQEKFSIYVPGLTKYLPYHESQPSVIRLGEHHYMWFVQLDAFSLLTVGKKGIGLATCPPLDEL